MTPQTPEPRAALAAIAIAALITACATIGCEPGHIGGGRTGRVNSDATGRPVGDGALPTPAFDSGSGGGKNPIARDSGGGARWDSGGGGNPRRDSGSPPPPPPPKPDATVDSAPPVAPCAPIAGQSYAQLSATQKTDRPAAVHGDLNLKLRRRRATSSTLGLINVGGPTDPRLPPQLYTLFADERTPTFSAAYQVEHWDWGCNCAKGWMTSPPVTLAGMKTRAGEVIRVPKAAYDIGGGHAALVLYAARDTITLKYTREDNVVKGYAVHISGICVEPSLLALYKKLDAAGRGSLPAVRPKQPIGRAAGVEIQVAIRDTGAWMDPRVRKDWYQGR